MKTRLFDEGGPHQIRRIGRDTYSLSIAIPPDSQGRVARKCPNNSCSPGYFKVTPGTGIVDGDGTLYCPYCRTKGESSDFLTSEQERFVRDVAASEATKGVSNMIKDALGLGRRGKTRIGGGLLSIEMSLKESPPRPVRRPFEEEVRRDVVCPSCTLDQTVFGLAMWCSDCGSDIFETHVSAELSVCKLMLDDVPRRRDDLGVRVAAKDLENCLEDVVSIFEAATKVLVRRRLSFMMESDLEIDREMRNVGNAFQSMYRTRKELERLFSVALPEDEVWDRMHVTFERRHPIAHNLGVIDKKYVERASAAEREGRDVLIDEQEVAQAIMDAKRALRLLSQALSVDGEDSREQTV